MTRNPLATATLLLGAALLAGCNSSDRTPTIANPNTNEGNGSQTIVGYVVSSNSGAPVTDTTVTVDGTKVRAKTNAEGRFTLRLNPGAYNLNFEKAGYAASRIEGVRVTAGANAQLNVIQKVAFATTLPAKAPLISAQAVVGVDPQDFPNDPAKALAFDASTGIPLKLKVSAADEKLSPDAIYAAVGNTPGSGFYGPRFYEANDPKNTTYTKTVTLSGSQLRGMRGDTYLHLVAYDFNNNRTEKRIPIKLNDDRPNTDPLGAITNFQPRAVTIAQKFNFNSAIAPTGTTTEESSLWVDLAWNYEQGLSASPTGYRIWTSDDGNNYTLLKTMPGNSLLARDSAPTLQPGRKVHYRLEAYNSTHSVYSPSVSVTPLDTFTLNTFTPANHSRDVSVTPTLSWNVSKKVGAYRKFYVFVNDYPSQGAACFWGFYLCGEFSDARNNVYTDDGQSPALNVTNNTYSVLFNHNGTALKPTLEPYHSYTMDVSAAAFSASGDAVSIAQDYYGIFYPIGACNFGGPVCEGQLSTFTTGDGSK